MSFVLGGLLYLLVYFDGVPTSCLLDTGASRTLIADSLAQRIGTRQGPLSRTALTGLGGAAAGEVFRIPHVGTTTMGWSGVDVVVLRNDALPVAECILGADLLSRQDLVLSWRDASIRPLSPPALTPAV